MSVFGYEADKSACIASVWKGPISARSTNRYDSHAAKMSDADTRRASSAPDGGTRCDQPEPSPEARLRQPGGSPNPRTIVVNELIANGFRPQRRTSATRNRGSAHGFEVRYRWPGLPRWLRPASQPQATAAPCKPPPRLLTKRAILPRRLPTKTTTTAGQRSLSQQETLHFSAAKRTPTAATQQRANPFGWRCRPAQVQLGELPTSSAIS